MKEFVVTEDLVGELHLDCLKKNVFAGETVELVDAQENNHEILSLLKSGFLQEVTKESANKSKKSKVSKTVKRTRTEEDREKKKAIEEGDPEKEYNPDDLFEDVNKISTWDINEGKPLNKEESSEALMKSLNATSSDKVKTTQIKKKKGSKKTSSAKKAQKAIKRMQDDVAEWKPDPIDDLLIDPNEKDKEDEGYGSIKFVDKEQKKAKEEAMRAKTKEQD